MNENLDLVKILKNVPKGITLWSPICGVCTLLDVSDKESDDLYVISCETVDRYGNKSTILFTKYGTFCSSFANGECVLFPSKENRDWSTFKAPNTHKHFEPFQKVLHAIVNEVGYEEWFADIYSHYNDLTREHYLVSGFVLDDDDIIPYEGNEDKLGKPVKNDAGHRHGERPD